MLGAQRSGEAGEHAGTLSCCDERLQCSSGTMSGRAPRFLSAVSSIKPAKPASCREPNKIEFYALIGEQHADEQHLAKVELAETLERRLAPDRALRPTLTMSAPAPAMAMTARAVASTSSVGSPMVALTGMCARNARADGLDGRRAAARPARRLHGVLGIDDVGGEMGAQQRLGLVRHAGKQPRRSARVFHPSLRILEATLRRRCAAAPSAPSRGRSDRPPKAAPEHPGR